MLHRAKHNYELDMTHGKLIPKVAAFAVPLMLTSILQLLYNAADVIVVGRCTGKEALAAVGSTASLINLIVNVFLGLSVGTNVVAARYYGANDYRGTQETVHTSILISLIGGVGIGIFGFIFGGTFLAWMGSPESVLPLATQYIRIYFIGMPFNMLYNFGAAVLRAVGDTRRPLYFLTVSGLVNVLLNLLFVIGFRMGVAGMALVGGDGVLAHADHHRVEFAEAIVGGGEGAGLTAAAGGVVPGIEVEHDPLSGEVGQAHVVAVLVLKGEVRGDGIDFKHS